VGREKSHLESIADHAERSKKKRMEKKQNSKKPFEFYYDPILQKNVLEIYDTEKMFPLLVKAPLTMTYELVHTKKETMHLRK
jgi:hypothetical protein